nr:autotransporter-associated beta strand repeat-containing protein [Kiritimatiellia bacterium]
MKMHAGKWAFIGILASALGAQALTYPYTGTPSAMLPSQTVGYDAVDWNITGGYFNNANSTITYTNQTLTFTRVTQNNGYGGSVTQFSSGTTVTGAGAFSLTSAGLAQDYVFAGNMQGYTGNLSIADSGSATLTLGNTGSSVVQYGGTTSGGNKALGTVTSDGTGNWINNVAGSGSLSVNNVVFNYATDASYDYVKVTNAIAQRDSVNFIGSANVLASGVISGGGALNKSGSGTVTLSAANTATGNTNVSGGTLKIGTGGSLYSTGGYFFGAGVTISGGGVLETRNWDYGNGNALNQLRNNYFAVVLDNGTVRFTENTSSLRAFQVNSG